MKELKRRKIPQVAVLLDSCHETSRGMLRGIFEYVRLYGPWAINIVTGGVSEQQLPDPRFWKGSGIIANAYSREMAAAIAAARLPTVIFDLHDEWQETWYAMSHACQVQCDSTATGRLAADFFLQKGFTCFAFVGKPNRLNWSRWRQESFVKRLAEAGFSCHLCPNPPPAQRKWDLNRKQLIRWLRQLPKPIAIFAANDLLARQVLDTCLIADIRVPYEAAVLGVDNDPLICETCIPSLTSIRLDVEAAGYAAAELLDQRMFGTFKRHAPKEIRTYPPLEVVARLSTQPIHVNDKLVIDALEFIRINAGLNIRVSDVAEHVKVTPRWLEKRFDSVLGISVIDEIKRLRMETVLRLITETQQPFDQIARKCGFSSVNHLRKIFREKQGESMSAYRSEHIVLKAGTRT
ncbi:MAG TPA: XylR family transcriptional regulator [Kiritimatiellia bacterium]|nr:XylR family transcriptional regulator [Kiritimatiellia bacterium]HRU71098.1 XylR family transcriptional regulator [Kiritimatiellia bacterium]